MEFDMDQRNCADCGTLFLPTHGRNRYCPAHRGRAAERLRETVERTCIACGSTWQTRRTIAKFCSDTCKGQWYSDTRRTKCPLPKHHPVMAAIREMRAAARAAAAAKRKAPSYSWRTARQCPGCACMFTPLYTPNAITCSKRCARRVHRWRRKAREAGATGAFTWSEFMRIAARFNFRCAYCDERVGQLEPDHVVPLSRGGSNSTTNLLPSCHACNTDKSANLLHEWAISREARGLPPRVTSWAPEDRRFRHLTEALLCAAA